MGYQRVSGKRRWLIFNAEVAVAANEDWWLDPDDLAGLLEFYFLQFGADGADEDDHRQCRVNWLNGLQRYRGRRIVDVHGSYPSTSRIGEIFYRYTAFRPDRRIAPDGSVLPGTYVTTENDKPHVPSGLAAVGRYALPNPAPAIYEYKVEPLAGSIIRCGTCGPLFGQAGGGVEVLLVVAAPAGHATYIPATIPER